MKYRHKRQSYITANLPFLVTSGEYDMPEIKPNTRSPDIKNLITFNYAKSCKNPTETYVCFYVDDYQFERIWFDTKEVIEMLKKFKGVIAPDFSLYRDFPEALNIYNDWRNKVLTRLMQDEGINVIPNVSWAGKNSYKYCFDGLPKHSVVAVSTNGCIKEKVARQLFLDGYKEMIKRLEPKTVLFVGSVPIELENEENILHFAGYTSIFNKPAINLANVGI